jgi:UDP-3-O-[3-hydroxymyristoyl] glucosamine N-acyltransferase
VEIASFTLIGKSIREKGSYSGVFPFSNNQEWRKNAAHLRHLDKLVDRIKQLEQQMAALNQASKNEEK